MTAFFAAGAFLATPLVRRFDKKPAACVGVALVMAGNALLLLVFGGGLLRPHATLSLPVAGATAVPAR